MRLGAASVLALAALAIVPAAVAADYPNRPIKLLVGFPAGQGTDTLARLLAERLAASLRQPVVVENRPGQGGSVALTALVAAPADGYTMMISSNGALVVNPHLFKSITYDPLKDVKPVSLVADLPMVVVAGKSAPYADLRGMLQHARQNPGKVTFASPGTFAFLWMALIQRGAGVEFYPVNYPGSAKAIVDMIAGRVDFSIDTIAAVRGFVESGELKLLAVGPEKRMPNFPGAPTIGESGLSGIVAKAWLGLVFPGGVADDIVRRVNADVRVALDGGVNERFASAGAVPRSSTAAEFAMLLQEEFVRWKDVVRQSGVKAE